MARDAHTRSLPDASNGPTHVHYLVPTLAHSCSLPGTYTSHRCLLQWGTYTGQRDGHYKASTLDRLLLQAWDLSASAIGHLRVKSVFSQPVCWQSQAGLYRMVQLVILLQPLSHKYFASVCNHVLYSEWGWLEHQTGDFANSTGNRLQLSTHSTMRGLNKVTLVVRCTKVRWNGSSFTWHQVCNNQNNTAGMPLRWIFKVCYKKTGHSFRITWEERTESALVLYKKATQVNAMRDV